MNNTTTTFGIITPKTTPQRRRRRKRKGRGRSNKVRPADYAQCYYNLRQFLQSRIEQQQRAILENKPPPDLTPTEDEIRDMFGKDHSKQKHAAAVVNPNDALDPAIQESANYVPFSGPGLGAGCNPGAPCHAYNRQDPEMIAMRLWPEDVLGGFIKELSKYFATWVDEEASIIHLDPFQEHCKPIGASQIRYRKPRPLW